MYCGTSTIAWEDFSDALLTFIEVKAASQRLSEVMKKNPMFHHVPGWSEYVPTLGASLLVDATGSLFRVSESKRTPLRTLEYLVSSLYVFEATIPHDTIYALLAIAKDTNPVAVTHDDKGDNIDSPASKDMGLWTEEFYQMKPYPVDYSLSFVEVCKTFIKFAIRRSDETDPTHALDILCRPWAPSIEPRRHRIIRGLSDANLSLPDDHALPTWISKLSGAAFAMFPHPNAEYRIGRKNADSLVGLPEPRQRNYSASQTRRVELKHLRFEKRDESYSMYVQGFILDTVDVAQVASQRGNIPAEWAVAAGWTNLDQDPPDSFWRTLVADRGPQGQNPPTFYARVCKESMATGLASGSLDTSQIIHYGRSRGELLPNLQSKKGTNICSCCPVLPPRASRNLEPVSNANSTRTSWSRTKRRPHRRQNLHPLRLQRACHTPRTS
jgi:hypothetical protein